MADRLPASAAASEAIEFALARLPTILRYAWAPFIAAALLIGVIVTVVVDVSGVRDIAEEGASAAALFRQLQMPVAEFVVVGVLVFACATFAAASAQTTIFELAATGADRPGLFHFRVDAAVWRVFAAFVIMGALSVVVWGLAVILAHGLTGRWPWDVFGPILAFMDWAAAAKPGSEPPPELLEAYMEAMKPVVAAFLLAVIPNTYLSVKLAPFAAGTAVENRLIPFKAFAMTRGAAWSVFANIILFSIGVFVLTLIVSIAVQIIDLIGAFLVTQSGLLAALGALTVFVSFIMQIAFQMFALGGRAALGAIIYRRLETGA